VLVAYTIIYTIISTTNNISKLQLLKNSANPEHPFSKFGSGCLETLAAQSPEHTRAGLLQFNAEHYVAPRMKLAVMGSQSLDQLEQEVRTTFGHVRTGSAGILQQLAVILKLDVYD
jgi:secreted Zn-dependent insulinase-like peptidase